MRLLSLLVVLLLPQAALAATCRDTVFEEVSFTVCEVAASEDLRLFHAGPDGVLGSFNAVNDALQAEGATLGFAMNAGMYHADRAPVGLYVEQGRQTSAIVTREGPGNFGLLPNGVFCIGPTLRVIESLTFASDPTDCTYASQSGPMLVVNGQLHPKLIPDSDSTYIRNGVGVDAEGQKAFLVISYDDVNFHRFARFFLDVLGARNALYFDGNISRLYAPDLGRHDGGFPMGPIVGTVVPKG